MSYSNDSGYRRGRGEPEPRRRSGGRGSSRRRTTGGRSTRSARDPRATRARRPAPARGRPKAKKQRRWLRVLVRVGLLVVLLVAIAASVTGCVLYNQVADELPDPTKPLKGLDQTTKVLDRDGKVIAGLYAEQDRSPVDVADLPAHVKWAVVSTEDERFYEHEGVDFFGMLRALWVDVQAGDTVQGGSTITQQYVKNAFVSTERTFKRKAAEALLAYRVEDNYSKDEILQMYLNTIYFGHGAYGIQTAARAYFGKSAKSLTVPEAAMIAGVIKAPARFSPYMHMDAARKRRDTVLLQMRDQGHLTEAQYAEAIAAPIKLYGLHKGAKTAPYFMEFIKEQLVREYGSDAVYRQGLRVRTTLDIKMQRAAEAAIKKRLNRKGDPSAAIVAIDPKTGEILAMVGGRDFAPQQYNVAAQGHRQPGSSFKPFVLVTALKEGVSPEATFTAGSITIKIPGSEPWKVASHGGGVVRLRTGLEKSINPVFAQLVMKVGADDTVETLRSMGITTKITPVPAVALGGQAEGVSPLEMASAYGTLANGGKHMSPFAISEVKDSKGVVLQDNKPTGSKVLDADIAYLTTDIMRGVITKGTGTAADIDRPAAGKTGTTQRNSDAWFVGYTPQIVTAVWVGFPKSMKPMTDVHGIQVYGGSFPAEIWAAFMRKALSGKPAKEFAKPDGLKTLKICLDTGQKATKWCPSTGRGLFLADDVPGPCAKHAVPEESPLPKLIGLAKDKAIAELRKLDLVYTVLEREDARATPGTVIAQSPAAGTKVERGSRVVIDVAKAPDSSEPPTAKFSFSPTGPRVNESVSFDGSASRDDEGIKSYVWEFGDGAKDTRSGKKAKHTYRAIGTYEVTLWVSDADGQTVTLTKTISVR